MGLPETQIQRYFPYPPAEVWDALVDPASWWERPAQRVDVAIGNAYAMTTPQVLGTRFTGEFDIEILDAAPGEHLTTGLVARAQSGPAARWTRRVDFREHEGGTQLTVTNAGVNLDDREERFLLRIVKEIQETELEGLAALFEQRAARGSREPGQDR